MYNQFVGLVFEILSNKSPKDEVEGLRQNEMTRVRRS